MRTCCPTPILCTGWPRHYQFEMTIPDIRSSAESKAAGAAHIELALYKLDTFLVFFAQRQERLSKFIRNLTAARIEHDIGGIPVWRQLLLPAAVLIVAGHRGTLRLLEFNPHRVLRQAAKRAGGPSYLTHTRMETVGTPPNRFGLPRKRSHWSRLGIVAPRSLSEYKWCSR